MVADSMEAAVVEVVVSSPANIPLDEQAAISCCSERESMPFLGRRSSATSKRSRPVGSMVVVAVAVLVIFFVFGGGQPLPTSSAFVVTRVGHNQQHNRGPSSYFGSVTSFLPTVSNNHEVGLSHFDVATNGQQTSMTVSIEQPPSVPNLLVNENNKGDFEQLSEKFSDLVFDSDIVEEEGDGDEGEEGEPEGELSPPVCRVVTRSDSKLPTSRSVLPSVVFKGDLLRRLDDIYHSVAHGQTRNLKYGANTAAENNNADGNHNHKNAPDDEEEEEMISVTRTSLEDAGFQLLSRRDLELCEALNAGYLLRLSIVPDVAELDPNLAREFYPTRYDDEGNLKDGEEDILFDGRVLVYWRGYSEEVSRGRLLLPKLDYLQASIVQRSAASVRARLNVFERWFGMKITRLARATRRKALRLSAAILEKFSNIRLAKELKANINIASNNETGEYSSWKNLMSKDGKIFKLARYGGSKIRFVGSPNPTDALNPFIICEEEYCPPCLNARDSYMERLNAEKPGRNVDRDMYQCLNKGGLKCPYDSVTDDQKKKPGPLQPMQLLKRVTISSLVDLFSSEGRRDLLRTLFSKSELVEPTYEEVVVVWRPLHEKEPQKIVIRPPRFVYDFADMFDIEGLPELPKPEPKNKRKPLEIRSFSGVPMANVPAVLPKTKLIFRPADAFVFDSISIFSLLLIIGSQKFNSTRLDLLALVSVSLWVIRTVLRYSNKLARYDLLVKKFLTSKISYRNKGALSYIATEAGSQRAVRASLVHSWLSGLVSGEPLYRPGLVHRGETEVNELIQDYRQLPVDVDAGLRDLETLGLASFSSDGELTNVVRGSRTVAGVLKDAWRDIFDGRLTMKAQRPAP